VGTCSQLKEGVFGPGVGVGTGDGDGVGSGVGMGYRHDSAEQTWFLSSGTVMHGKRRSCLP
jgi:hypothetical protein